MQKLILSSDWQSKLRHIVQITELCDEGGRTIGYFAPSASRASYSGVDGRAPEEELERRESESGGRPLDEIMADLEKRG